jgi:hypothetical protein
MVQTGLAQQREGVGKNMPKSGQNDIKISKNNQKRYKKCRSNV